MIEAQKRAQMEQMKAAADAADAQRVLEAEKKKEQEALNKVTDIEGQV